MGKKKASDGEPAEEDDSLLTYSNLVSVCTAYARDQSLRTDDLGEVLQSLTTNTRWIPSHTMLKSGVGQFYFDLFRSRMTSAPAPVWWDSVDAGSSASSKKKRARTAPPPAAKRKESVEEDDEDDEKN